MKEYEVTLPHGVVTTMQLDDDEAKRLGAREVKRGRSSGDVEVAAEVERPKSRKSRGAGKETR